MPLNNGTFLLLLAPAFSANSPGCSCTIFQALQAVPVQSITVLIPGLSSKPRVLAPNPALTSGHLSQAGMHRVAAPTIFAGFSLSCLPQTVVALSSLASEAPFLSQGTSLLVRMFPRVREPFFFFSSLPAAQVLSCFLFFFSTLLVPWRSVWSF